MKQMMVTLGNQFICDKKILNIVQKTKIMSEKEIEKYMHTHQFLKDQRVIVVDSGIDVKTGYLFNGAEFIDPVNLRRIPIEGVNEEETENVTDDTFDKIIEMIQGFNDKLDSIVKNTIPIPSDFVDEENKIRNFFRPKIFKIEKDIPVYSTPDKKEVIGIIRAKSNIVAYGMDAAFSSINVGENMYIEYDFPSTCIGEDIGAIHDRDGKKIAIGYFENRKYEIGEIELVDMNIDEYKRREKLQKLIDSNMTRKEIAAKFNVTPPTISKWVKKYNIIKKEV